MSAPITDVTSWQASDYDMIIDVRSPIEFADDHIPGAVNMPVLSDEERVTIGTLYKQESPFIARKKGAALVARNIADHLDTKLFDLPSSFSPLIHCWRGGQRSHAFARICSEVGWRSYVLTGGYKQYRRDVMSGLEAVPSTLSFIVVAGRTGSRKTDILTGLKAKGAQVLDLEGIANHRGSLLGHIKDSPQPSQRMFESQLNKKLQSFDPERPVYVESESSKVGNVQLAPELWKSIAAAPQIAVSAPRTDRATYLLGAYEHLTHDISDLNKLVTGMTHRHGRERTDIWQALIDAKDWQLLAVELLEAHYDPAYDRSMERHDRFVHAKIEMPDCSDNTLEGAVTRILAYGPVTPSASGS